MKKIFFILSLFFAIFSLESCKKENRISKELTGTWTFVEYKRFDAHPVTDFSAGKITFEFFKYKNAYARSMKGVYKLDYNDPALVDKVDTFQYELKGAEITLSKIKTPNSGTNKSLYGFLKRRYRIIEWKKDKLELERTDSAGCYIKAVKN